MIIPEKIKSRNSDYVSFDTSIDGIKFHEHKNKPCYAGYMGDNLTKYVFRCRPNGEFVLSNTMFKEWINLCKKNYLVPKKSMVFGNCLRIDGRNSHQKTVYAALCCYRWADSTPEIPWLVVTILRKNPKIHFFQALYYSIIQYSRNSGHSFIGTYKDSLMTSFSHVWVSKLSTLAPYVICEHYKNIESTKSELNLLRDLGISFADLTDKCVKTPKDFLSERWTKLYKTSKKSILKQCDKILNGE